MLTDSGGFQVFSLSDSRKITGGRVELGAILMVRVTSFARACDGYSARDRCRYHLWHLTSRRQAIVTGGMLVSRRPYAEMAGAVSA